jgi:hypothetical protein
MGQFDTQQNGVTRYSATTPKRKFFGAEETVSSVKTIKSGQVLKAGTFLESDSAGKLIAHGSIAESALVTFTAALTSGQTLIMAGLTWTAGSSGTTVAQLVTAWKDIASGTGYAALSARTGGGTFTAGTLTGYATEAVDANSVIFNAATALANATDVAATGTGTAPTITITAGTATFNKIAGVTMYDVDATAGDVDASVFIDASFWAQDDGYDFLLWAVDPAVDVITLSTGATVACTAYNTGCKGTSKAVRLLKQKFVEGSEFSELGFFNAGDNYGAV